MACPFRYRVAAEGATHRRPAPRLMALRHETTLGYVSVSSKTLDRALTRADSQTPLVFIVAGEASGDNLAARLMAALRRATGDRVRFAGVGGASMATQGLHSLFPMRDLSLIGMAEVLPHLPRLIRCLRTTTASIEANRPAVVVTVDSPGFFISRRQAHSPARYPGDSLRRTAALGVAAGPRP